MAQVGPVASVTLGWVPVGAGNQVSRELLSELAEEAINPAAAGEAAQ
jgi:diacylglycerol kinase family enzyme